MVVPESDEVFDIRDQKPAGSLLHLPHGHLVLREHGLPLLFLQRAEKEKDAMFADLDEIAVLETEGLDYTPAIEVGAIAAALVDEPVFTLFLRVNKRMEAGGLVGTEVDGVGFGAPDGTLILDLARRGIIHLQPGV